MERNIDYEKARDLLLEYASPVGSERFPLEESFGRVLAEDFTAAESVPSFDRSPYDGYAFRAEDSREASPDHPVTLRVLEEVRAGGWPTQKVGEGTAVKILTGAPIPEGADAVVMYERTRFTADQVTLTRPARSGENIVYAGEDVKKGQQLARAGMVIDPGLAGTLAAQGEIRPLVYRRPRIGLIFTGSEVADQEKLKGREVPRGKIRNSNRYILTAELLKAGCIPVYFGLAEDCTEEIARRITEAAAQCDAVLLTGGVSAGDYDLTCDAMEAAGVSVLVRGVKMKPGMACAYGVKDGKLVCGLSGNPASSVTNFHAVVMPSVRKMCGQSRFLPRAVKVELEQAFRKKSPGTRLLRGIFHPESGKVKMSLPREQGNAVISSGVGCDVLAVVPAGSGELEAGTVLDGFLL